MTTAEPLLAKSKGNGGTTLLDHTAHVLDALLHMAPHFKLTDYSLASAAAVLHDAGKAHPKFQGQLREANGERPWTSLHERRLWTFKHRHELSSLLFLPWFPQSQWDQLIEMIVGHHKSIHSLEGDSASRGLIDLISESGSDRVFQNHARSFGEWSLLVLDMMNKLGYNFPPIDETSARKAWDYAVTYCAKTLKERSWSALRGALMAADHFASAMAVRTGNELKKTFITPDLSPFDPAARGGVLFPLADISSADDRPHTLLIAPTGAGKTNFLMRRSKGRRVFYILPFQASINAMWLRFRELLPDSPVRMQHAAARLTLKQEDPEQFEDEFPLHNLVGASVKVLTPHQLGTVILGLPGFESVMLDLKGTSVVLDEIHTYAGVSRSMVLEIVKVLLQLECTVHIGTATMPTVLYNDLLALLGGKDNTYEVRLEDEQLASFNRHRVYKIVNWDDCAAIMEGAMRSNEKVLIVCNTVGKAQATFQKLRQRFGHFPHMLIHSRFRRKDRAEKERKLRNEFEGRDGKGLCPCWVVSTQVVEVSLDISFDRMITDCAPIDSLIQRFGRINRRRTLDTLGVLKPVHVVAPDGDIRPYDKQIVLASFNILPEDGDMLLEGSLHTMIDAVYPDSPDLVNLSAHLIWRNGQFLLPPLCNRNSQVLHETLDIASAACVLESDFEQYVAGNWDERMALEIPVSYRAIAFHARRMNYRQIGTGSRPFVIPHQGEDEHRDLGLILQDYDSFI